MSRRKQPLIYGTFNLYLNGGLDVVGVAECTLPQFEGRSETLSGAGIMGEIEVTPKGQYSAMTFTANFRALYDPSILSLPIGGDSQTFDLRPALEVQDIADGTREIVPERWTINGPIKTINPGGRGTASAADASIEQAVYNLTHYVDGKEVRKIGVLTGIDVVNGVDQYAATRAAIS